MVTWIGLRGKACKMCNMRRQQVKHPPSISSGKHQVQSVSVLLMLLVCVRPAAACRIQDADIGVCDTAIRDDEEYRLYSMPWCGPFVRYTACVPKYKPLPPSREHPNGRWYNNTILHKDQWVHDFYEQVVAERYVVEKNRTLQREGVDEHGRRGSPVPRFVENPDCRDAFRNYLCWTNFPRCDEVTGETLMMCRSACENLMISCQNHKDLWRCGESQFFNGYSPEKPTYVNGLPTYLRDFFPGQPFTENKYRKRRKPLPVCTPSLKGSGGTLRPAWGVAFSSLLAVVAALLAYSAV